MLCFLVTFNIIIYYIFPKIPLKFFTSSILTIFVNCLDFFTFSCYKKTNVVKSEIHTHNYLSLFFH